MKKVFLVAVILCFAFAAAASADQFSADTKMTMMGQTTIGKIYFKDIKTNRQEMMGMAIIYEHPVSYQLFESTKQYVITDVEELKRQNPMLDVEDYEEFIEKNMEKVGSETLQGYKCGVYEGDIAVTPDTPSVSMKLWYSEKLEYPIKSEVELGSPMGKMITILENIKIGKQPGTLFKIPSGYTEAKSVQEAMGMGGFGMPTGGGDSAEMPPQEDMEEMMRQAQEMMKGMQNQ